VVPKSGPEADSLNKLSADKFVFPLIVKLPQEKKWKNM